jgi:predicted Zn finger-like uncharacterized protein
MQVTCPNCGARYAVDPLAIGPVGRIVQCARCANRWLQTVAAAAAQAAAREAVEDALKPPPTAPGWDGVTAPVAEDPVGEIPVRTPSGPALGSARAVEAIEPVPDLVIRPPRERNSLPAVIAPRRKSPLPVQIGIGLGVVVVIAAIGAALYFYHEPILAKTIAVARFIVYYL